MSDFNSNQKSEKVLALLHDDSRISLEQMATMLNMPMDEVAGIIDKLETDGIIMGYGAHINWDKAYAADMVEAYIELKVTPQRSSGFDRIAERIYQFPEVKTVSLMSGGYDFGISVRGKNIREISLFVSEHLSSMESVVGTSTHFVLKRYKYDGIVCCKPGKDEREVFSV